jgi:ABC-type Fe3+-hydroxamate transport system substrate-binding protein
MAESFPWRLPWGRGVVLLAGVVWMFACDPPEKRAEAPPAPSPFPAAPTLRVVSLSRAASEFLVALGAGDQIVAVGRGSNGIPALAELPVVDLPGVERVAADLVVLPESPAGEEPRAEALRSAGYEVIVFAPHDFEEAFALCRGLGARLVGAGRAMAFELALSRELARIGGASFGRPRPRVAGLVGPAPLELAGGHNFITDLIEIAGASSVTHGGAELRIPIGPDGLRAFAPDLLLVVTPDPLPESERAEIRRSLPAAYPVEFFVFDAEHRWMHEAAQAARRLRAMIEPLSDELDRTTLPPAGHAQGGSG